VYSILGAKVWEKYKTKLLGAPKLGSNEVRCCVSFVLFLVKPEVKPSCDTTTTIGDDLYN